MQGAYIFLLALATGLAMVQSDPRIKRCTYVIGGSWAANMTFVLTTGIYDPWAWFMVTDAVCAYIILRQPAGRMQASIGTMFAMQIVVHASYALVDNKLAAEMYGNWLTAIGLMQLLALIIWTGARGCGRFTSNWGFSHSGQPVGSASYKSVD